MKKIEIYTTNYCPFCVKAKSLLKKKSIKFSEIDVSNDEALREKMTTMANGAKKSLKKNMINYIEVEVMLFDYYVNKIKLYEIDYIMNKNNFELVDIQGHNYSKKNQINWFDMLYINKKFSQKRN